MPTQKIGDYVIAKREDGQYDVLRIIGLRVATSHQPRTVRTLEEARALARTGLSESGGDSVWYRDHRDEADHLEPF